MIIDAGGSLRLMLQLIITQSLNMTDASKTAPLASTASCSHLDMDDSDNEDAAHLTSNVTEDKPWLKEFN